MDIYGVKKYKLEQVFPDITKVLVRLMMYKSIQLIEQVYL